MEAASICKLRLVSAPIAISLNDIVPRDVLQNFASLGGAASDGYVSVGFSDSATDVTYEAGDTITVYELGRTLCADQPTWDDDPYEVDPRNLKDIPIRGTILGGDVNLAAED